MPVFSIQHKVKQDADFLFELVANIESYPEFLPACQEAKIIERGEDYIIASLLIGYGLIKENFVSHVKLNKKEGKILASLKDGALKHLTCEWDFSPQNQGTIIKCELELKFHSGLLKQIATPLLGLAIKKLMESFIQRAEAQAAKPQ